MSSNIKRNVGFINRGDVLYQGVLRSSAMVILLVVIILFGVLIVASWDALEEFGFLGFLFSSEWDPTKGRETYGALTFIIGTLATSIPALLICIPFSLPVAIFVGEYYKGRKIARLISSLIDLLAGIPSIVFGLWGFYALRPIIDFLDGDAYNGIGIFTSAIILAIMIIPYASSLSAQFISMTPKGLKEAAYSMGCTRTEVIRHVILPNSRSGIVAAYILALGRALGETMAVTMLIGNTDAMPKSFLDTGQSMASLIANQFSEAEGLKLSSLMAIALALFLVTAIINVIAKLILVNRGEKTSKEVRKAGKSNQ